jgi:DDE superfamily endonuclease
LFDESVYQKWINNFLKQFVWGNDAAFLLVDHYKVHMMRLFVTACNNIGVDVDYIPAGDNFVLQPVDVGFDSPFKRHTQDFHHKKYRGVSNAMKLPTPDRDDTVTWIYEVFDKISEMSTQK